MGNIPLCVPKKNGIEFSDYMDIARGRFSLRSVHPYEVSLENLRPVISVRDNDGGDDSATILGLEMDQESVGLRFRSCIILHAGQTDREES